METYDFSTLADGNFGSSMDGGASSNSIGSDMGGTGSGTGGFGSGMGGGTNSFGSGMGGGEGADLEQMFGESPWGGLKDVGFTSLEQVFRGNAGGNLQRGDNTSGGSNNQGEGDPLLSGGEGNTSSNGYTFNFSSLP